jgi:hypothetical protein
LLFREHLNYVLLAQVAGKASHDNCPVTELFLLGIGLGPYFEKLISKPVLAKVGGDHVSLSLGSKSQFDKS